MLGYDPGPSIISWCTAGHALPHLDHSVLARESCSPRMATSNIESNIGARIS